MGVTGPIPKRSEERIRRNKTDLPIDKVSVIGEVIVPDLNIPGRTHPFVQDLYDSLKDSGQAKFYEPSDWEMARIVCLLLNKELKKANASAMMLATITSQLSSLLVTEGDRRRVQMEVERNTAPEDNVVNVADVLKERMKNG